MAWRRSAAGSAAHGTTRLLTSGPEPSAVMLAGLAAGPAWLPACLAAGRPPGRAAPPVPPGVLGPRDRFQVTVAEFDEAAGRDRAARHPAPATGHDRGHDAADLEDVVLADELVQPVPGPAGQRPGVPGRRRVTEPVALVPVAGHPGPGVLGHLPVHQQRPLERVQQVEGRAGRARAPGGLHEDGDTRVEPGHPPGLVQAAFTRRLGHDHGGPGRGRGGHGVQHGEQPVQPGARFGPHVAQRADHGRR